MIVQINRAFSVPIYTQIVGQLQFDIVSGRLSSGTQLPSIRDLARQIDVAPMTVSQAYQELKRLGLLEMRPGLGTFVATFDRTDGENSPRQASPNRSLHLRRILQRAVSEAAHHGFTEDEISQAFLSVLTDSQGVEMDHSFVLVGMWKNALHVYADDIERQLAAERVVVEPLTFAELVDRPSYHQPWLDRAQALLVPLHQVRTVQEVLADANLRWTKPILGLSFCLRPSTVTAITDLPSGLRLGILSRLPEFVNSMVQGVAALYPFYQEPVIGLATDDKALDAVAGSAQAVVYASGSEEYVACLRQKMAVETPFIEYLHTPDQAAYARIHQFLASEVGTAPA